MERRKVEIIFTSRPLSWRPISWVNAVTRFVTRCPFDHVSLEFNDWIYESVAGKGVHKIHWTEWIKDRGGSYLFIYRVPREKVSFNAYVELEGKKYDYKANFLYLLGLEKYLKDRANNRIYCSELVAHLFGWKQPYKHTPKDVEKNLRAYESYIMEI